jgi:hypothetical protein
MNLADLNLDSIAIAVKKAIILQAYRFHQILEGVEGVLTIRFMALGVTLFHSAFIVIEGLLMTPFGNF